MFFLLGVTGRRFSVSGECRRILPDELLHARRPLRGYRLHVVRHPVVSSRAVQIGNRREVVHQVNRQAALEQPSRHGSTGMS
jgi:hypothetical protein